MFILCNHDVDTTRNHEIIVLAPGFLNPKSESRYLYPSVLEVSLNFLTLFKSRSTGDSNARSTVDLIR